MADIKNPLDGIKELNDSYLRRTQGDDGGIDDPIESIRRLNKGLPVARGQHKAVPEPEVNSLMDTVYRGMRQTENSMSANALHAGLTSPQEFAKGIAENEAINRSEIQHPDKLEAISAITDADGFWGTTLEVGKQMITNPSGSGRFAAEQVGNMLPIIGGGIAGGVAGSFAPIVGNVAGAFAGTALGTIGVETGAEVMAALQHEGIDISDRAAVEQMVSNPEFMDNALQRGLIRGGTIAAVDLATMGAGRWLMTAPARALTDDLTRLGFDVSTNSKLTTVLESGAKGVSEANDKYNQAKKLKPSIKRGIAPAAIEFAGEPLGEASAQLAVGDELDGTEIALEALGGGAASVATAGVVGAYDGVGKVKDNIKQRKSRDEEATKDETQEESSTQSIVDEITENDGVISDEDYPDAPLDEALPTVGFSDDKIEASWKKIEKTASDKVRAEFKDAFPEWYARNVEQEVKPENKVKDDEHAEDKPTAVSGVDESGDSGTGSVIDEGEGDTQPATERTSPEASEGVPESVIVDEDVTKTIEEPKQKEVIESEQQKKAEATQEEDSETNGEKASDVKTEESGQSVGKEWADDNAEAVDTKGAQQESTTIDQAPVEKPTQLSEKGAESITDQDQTPVTKSQKNAPVTTEADKPSFTPTHELPNGDLVSSTEEDNVYIDADGMEVEDDNATVITSKSESKPDKSEAKPSLDEVKTDGSTAPIAKAEQPTDVKPAKKAGILGQTEAQYVKKEAKRLGLKKDSAGYKNAVKDLKETYNNDREIAEAKLPFNEYAALPDNQDLPEPILKQSYDALREDLGVTTTESAEEVIATAATKESNPTSESVAADKQKPDGIDRVPKKGKKENLLRQLKNGLVHGIHPSGRDLTSDERAKLEDDIKELEGAINGTGTTATQAEVEAGETTVSGLDGKPVNTDRKYSDDVSHFADQLAEGGGIAYLEDEHGTINGKTQSTNPDWFQNGAFVVKNVKGDDHLAKTPSVKQIKAAVSANKQGKATKQQHRILEALEDLGKYDKQEEIDTAAIDAQHAIDDETVDSLLADGVLTEESLIQENEDDTNEGYQEYSNTNEPTQDGKRNESAEGVQGDGGSKTESSPSKSESAEKQESEELLTSYTEEGLSILEAERDQAAKDKKIADDKAKIDKEAEAGLELTGSDRAADTNANQDDLFSQMGNKVKESSGVESKTYDSVPKTDIPLDQIFIEDETETKTVTYKGNEIEVLMNADEKLQAMNDRIEAIENIKACLL